VLKKISKTLDPIVQETILRQQTISL